MLHHLHHSRTERSAKHNRSEPRIPADLSLLVMCPADAAAAAATYRPPFIKSRLDFSFSLLSYTRTYQFVFRRRERERENGLWLMLEGAFFFCLSVWIVLLLLMSLMKRGNNICYVSDPAWTKRNNKNRRRRKGRKFRVDAWNSLWRFLPKNAPNIERKKKKERRRQLRYTTLFSFIFRFTFSFHNFLFFFFLNKYYWIPSKLCPSVLSLLSTGTGTY